MVIKVIRHDGWAPVLMRHCFIRLCSTKTTKYLDDRYICGQVSVSLNAILEWISKCLVLHARLTSEYGILNVGRV